MVQNLNYRHQANIDHIVRFITSERVQRQVTLTSISLFSGAGISDIGFEQAGFTTYVQSELDEDRVQLCQSNFPESTIVQGNIEEKCEEIVAAYRSYGFEELDLLSVTPPCQGMSSSNPARGEMGNLSRRDVRNRLMLDAVPVIQALMPKVVIVENVTQILNEKLEIDGNERLILNLFHEQIGEHNYALFSGSVQMADYGIPQNRKRAIIVAIRRDQACVDYLLTENLLPWSKPSHCAKDSDLPSWITAGDWFGQMRYPSLDARLDETSVDPNDELHSVPSYEKDPTRYGWISDIPPRSGLSAYLNDVCHSCGDENIAEGCSHCPQCNEPMLNRPHVVEKNGNIRLIKGYSTAYRRIPVDKPTPTITTSSSHLGSNYKIHPWENRVLSIRECADLQTVPRFFRWDWALETKHIYIMRQVIGEALPSWFAYIQGTVIRDLLANNFENLNLVNGV